MSEIKLSRVDLAKLDLIIALKQEAAEGVTYLHADNPQIVTAGGGCEPTLMVCNLDANFQRLAIGPVMQGFDPYKAINLEPKRSEKDLALEDLIAIRKAFK